MTLLISRPPQIPVQLWYNDRALVLVIFDNGSPYWPLLTEPQRQQVNTVGDGDRSIDADERVTQSTPAGFRRMAIIIRQILGGQET